jgi:hypothetical protein
MLVKKAKRVHFVRTAFANKSNCCASTFFPFLIVVLSFYIVTYSTSIFNLKFKLCQEVKKAAVTKAVTVAVKADKVNLTEALPRLAKQQKKKLLKKVAKLLKVEDAVAGIAAVENVKYFSYLQTPGHCPGVFVRLRGIFTSNFK